MLIDTHSHVYDAQFDADRRETMERAQRAGVRVILLPAVEPGSYGAMFDMVRDYPDRCYPMMGLHPTLMNDNPRWRENLRQVAGYLENPPEGIRFVAVGETGLDLHWSRDFLPEQTEALRFQTELALKYDLPLMLHTRDAWDTMCDFLTAYRNTPLRVVLHSFSGTIDHYRMLASPRCRFGISGPATYKKSALAEIIPQMDPAHLLLETDSPYLPPVPYRGQRNESAYLPLICRRIAELLGMDPEELARITTRNAAEMFCLEI